MHYFEIMRIVNFTFILKDKSIASVIRKTEIGEGIHIVVRVDPTAYINAKKNLSVGSFCDELARTLGTALCESQMLTSRLSFSNTGAINEIINTVLPIDDSDMELIRLLHLGSIRPVGGDYSNMQLSLDTLYIDGKVLPLRVLFGGKYELNQMIHTLHARITNGVPAAGYRICEGDVIYRGRACDKKLDDYEPMEVDRVEGGTAYVLDLSTGNVLKFNGKYDPINFKPINETDETYTYVLTME